MKQITDTSEQLDVSKNRVIKILGVSKGKIYYKPKEYPGCRKSNKKRPEEHITAIQKICSELPTYGSPRIRALLERDYGIRLTKYMTYTIMKEEGLLIDRMKYKRSFREHTGRIIVNEPNTRWASDITTIKCWDGSKGRLAVIIDCCDRSVISWKFSKHMQASDLELLLQESLIKRFGGESPNGWGVEFLHDNGPEYIEKTFQSRMKEWNVVDCRTPTYSPQSNGMCEAFNWTFKRDYVYQSCLDDFETVKEKMPKWFELYNDFAPHSGLDMKTPNEFYQQWTAA